MQKKTVPNITYYNPILCFNCTAPNHGQQGSAEFKPNPSPTKQVQLKVTCCSDRSYLLLPVKPTFVGESAACLHVLYSIDCCVNIRLPACGETTAKFLSVLFAHFKLVHVLEQGSLCNVAEKVQYIMVHFNSGMNT